MRRVVARAISFNLKLNFNKCHVRQSSVPYVGHLITVDSLKSDPAKVEVIQSMLAPVNNEGIKSFLGFNTYLLKFIPNLGKVDAPLRQLLKRNVEFVWQPAHTEDASPSAVV